MMEGKAFPLVPDLLPQEKQRKKCNELIMGGGRGPGLWGLSGRKGGFGEAPASLHEPLPCFVLILVQGKGLCGKP